MSDIGQNFADIHSRVQALNPSAVLVAVSKTKPIGDLRAAFESGCTVFGENYVDEVIAKSPLLPDAKFHFIGHLQSNKVAKLCRCPNLAMVQTIASKVNRTWPTDRPPLPVLVQVNTSDEPQKFGVLHANPSLLGLVHFIVEQCPRLTFAGVMTIGECGESRRDFETLITVRQTVADDLAVPPNSLELSMGMSADYELALQMCATVVRVGSSIFGPRNYRR